MGHTVRNNKRYDDDDFDSRKHRKSAGKTKGTKVLNKYVEEDDYQDYDEDNFDESFETEYNNHSYGKYK